jgi:hypothetical protein
MPASTPRMNEATLPLAPPSPQADQQLSRANVFGLFLTLQICQFTQPYGSLLFRGYGGLFWRCNPIASFVEACIILLHLVHSTWRYTLDGQRADSGGLWKSWQQTASGLLLLRGAINDASGSDLMEKIMTGSFLEREQLNEAFGSNALAHREWRIDLVTMVSVLTVVVKISAIRGVPVLKVTAFAMFLGWLGMQVLLIFFHSREMSRSEMASSVNTVRRQNTILKLWSPLFLGLFMALHLPFFAYASYQITWTLSPMALIDILMRFATAGILGAVAAGMIAHVVHPLLRIFIQIASWTPWSLNYTYAGMAAPCVVIFIVLTLPTGRWEVYFHFTHLPKRILSYLICLQTQHRSPYLTHLFLLMFQLSYILFSLPSPFMRLRRGSGTFLIYNGAMPTFSVSVSTFSISV